MGKLLKQFLDSVTEVQVLQANRNPSYVNEE